MAKTSSSLGEAIMSRAENSRHGSLPWFAKLPADVLAELEQIRTNWESGATGLKKRAMARAIVAEMQSRRLPICGVQGVEGWLDRETG